MRLPTLATTLVVAAAFAFSALAGCTTANAQTGATALYVKDGPADDLAHLYVSFTQVEVHLKHTEKNETAEVDDDDEAGDDDGNETAEDDDGSDEGVEHNDVEGGTSPGTGRVSVAVEEDDDDDSAGEGRWITIFQGNATIDLRALNGTAKGFLGDGEVPVGVYNGIRIRVSSALAVFNDGTNQTVKVPSKALHIVGKFRVEQDMETALTLDFDLDKSLKETGSGQLILKPVLHLEQDHHKRPGDKERRERIREREDMDDEGREKVREHRGEH